MNPVLDYRRKKLSDRNKGTASFGGAALFPLDYLHEVQTPGKNLREVKPFHADDAGAAPTSECLQAVIAETAIADEQPSGPLRLAIELSGEGEQIRLSRLLVLPFRL